MYFKLGDGTEDLVISQRPDMERRIKEKAYRFLHKPYQELVGPE